MPIVEGKGCGSGLNEGPPYQVRDCNPGFK